MTTTESGLVSYAREELKRAGMFDRDADYGPELGEHIIEVIRAFTSFDHSGGSAAKTIAVLTALLAFEPLTPLTYADDEWIEVGTGVWQNRRKADVFSEDRGATWHCLDGTRGTRPDAGAPVPSR